MRIAVVGAGFAGLAVVWHALQKGHEVTLFDENGIGGGASGVSTGLLHPYPGRQVKLSWRAKEGMQASRELLDIASKDFPVFEQNGILRITTDNQNLWIPEGMTVYSRLYLQGLWNACKGAKLEKQKIHSLEELSPFDAIVLACGPSILQFADLPVKCTIGQTLLCRWTEKIPHSILALGHITPTEDPELCQVGSTYEHTEKPDPQKALDLLEKAALFYPPAKDFKIVEIRSGIRVSPLSGHRPLIQNIAPKAWAFTGLGSRGLLYHSMLAKSLIMNELFI